jgi:enediyne biosynthesis protein E4
LQQANGRFQQTQQKLKTDIELRENDTGVLLFDADGDHDLDLYCSRGGYQSTKNSPFLQDVLYRNEKCRFVLDSIALPRERANGRVVRAADFDRDGDLDLFVGGSVLPRSYPQADRSFLLRNDKGRFTDVTAQLAPELTRIGIINDALWTDPDQDGYPDLLLAGEWMPITLLKNSAAKKLLTAHCSLSTVKGWWTSLCQADFDGDGDMDYVAGNYGLNTAFHASEAEPLSVFANDFDKNGTYDAILAQYDNNAAGERHLFAFHTRDDLIKQSLLFRRKFLTYADFGRATFEQTLSAKERKGALTLQATELRSCYVENLGKGADGQLQFRLSPLPIEAQFSPAMAILATDVNRDSKPDVLLVGNDYGMETFQGQADAGCGLALINRGKGQFRALSPRESGFVVLADARSLLTLKGQKGRQLLLTTQHRGPLLVHGSR